MPVLDIIGAGWAYPGLRESDGNARMATGSDDIAQAIRLILATAHGERPMRPEFGCGIHDLVFTPIDASSAGLMEQAVREALERWEPRADIDDVTVFGDDTDDALVYIEVHFRPRGTNDSRNLVFPFYTIPSHSTDTP